MNYPLTYKKISNCLICGNDYLTSSINMGTLPSSGYFPKTKTESIPEGLLELLTCSTCSLTQLSHIYSPKELYDGSFYGYASSTNEIMLQHLDTLSKEIHNLKPDAMNFLDIGSNDGTLLKSHEKNFKFSNALVGCDPTIKHFRENYFGKLVGIEELFSYEAVQKNFSGKFDIITCIAMLYDLDEPNKFIHEIKNLLKPGGLFIIEQSYLPSMVNTNSFDTICHEHLEYYTLTSLKYLLEKNGFILMDASLNSSNGGSIRIYASIEGKANLNAEKRIGNLLDQEININVYKIDPLLSLAVRMKNIKSQTLAKINEIKEDGYKIAGYGASTKGNTFLNYLELNTQTISFIVDRNIKKVGRFTPGSNIPIVSEEDGFSESKVAYLVLPWHFKEGVIKREEARIKSMKSKLFFALPNYSEFK